MSPRKGSGPVSASTPPGTQPTPEPNPGPRNARTDDSGIRRYTWQGIEYPSVTSLRRMVGIPFTLHNWILSQHIEAALDLMRTPDTIEGLPWDEVGKSIRKLGTAKRDRAADLGNRVHASTAAGMVPDKAPPDEAPFLRQYQHWLKDQRPSVLLSERRVFNLRLGYGGSFDLLLNDAWGRLVLTDIKTGEGTYLDHVLQLLGYAFADFVAADSDEDRIDDEATRLLEQVVAIAILHLRPEGWRYIELVVDTRGRRAFESMARLAHWMDVESLDGYTSRVIAGSAPKEA